MSKPRRVVVVVVSSLVMGGSLHAGESPTIHDIRPRGARPGADVTLVITGTHFTTAGAELVTGLSAAARLVTDESDLKAEPGRVAFRFRVSPHEALGSRLLWLRTSGGLSNPVAFTVDSLDEREEREPNDGVEAATTVAPPCVLLGTLEATDRDHFRLRAGAGERLVIEVEARRLGSAVDPTLRLLRSNGQEIALSDDEPGLGVDCRIDHTFDAAGEYVVEVHDSLYAKRSPSFYRLRLAPAASYPGGIFPLGGRAGSAVDVRFTGGSIESPHAGRAGPHAAVGSRLAAVALPTALSGRAGWPFLFRVGTLPESLEGARGESSTPVPPLEVNTTINGRISEPREVDRYEIAVKSGRPYRFEVEARGLGSWLDPVLEIVEKGGRRLRVDDDGDDPDPRLELTVGETVNSVTVAVHDLHRRGGQVYAYRLTVREDPRDFELILKTPQVNLPLGATAMVEVECRRQGYAGAVDVSVAPIPSGFTMAGGRILAGQSRGYITLTGPREGISRLTSFEVFGEGGGPADPLVRRAQGWVVLTADQRLADVPLVVWEVKAAVTEVPPFSLSFRPEVRGLDVVVGHSASVPLIVTRQGIEGEVELSGISSLPGVTTAPKAKVPGDKAEANVTIIAAGNASVREGDLLIGGRLKAKAGPRRAVTPALNVRVVHPFSLILSGATGGSIAGEVVRVAPFAGKVDIKVGGLPAGLSAKPLTVDAGAGAFRVDLTASDDLAAGDYTVRLEATTPLKVAKKTVVHSIPPVPVKLKVSRERVRIEARIP